MLVLGWVWVRFGLCWVLVGLGLALGWLWVELSLDWAYSSIISFEELLFLEKFVPQKVCSLKNVFFLMNRVSQ